jgi:hypothetical protein
MPARPEVASSYPYGRREETCNRPLKLQAKAGAKTEIFMLAVVMHTSKPSTLRWRQDGESQASLGYIERPCLKKKKRKKNQQQKNSKYLSILGLNWGSPLGPP